VILIVHQNGIADVATHNRRVWETLHLLSRRRERQPLPPAEVAPVAGATLSIAEVTVRGAEGHSAYPETGASAILAAGRLLREVERIGVELEIAAGVAGIAFFPFFARDDNSQLLGLSRGLGLACLASALILA